MCLYAGDGLSLELGNKVIPREEMKWPSLVQEHMYQS